MGGPGLLAVVLEVVVVVVVGLVVVGVLRVGFFGGMGIVGWRNRRGHQFLGCEVLLF